MVLTGDHKTHSLNLFLREPNMKYSLVPVENTGIE